MSKAVAVPQVAIRATPDAAGVHRKTCSAALALAAAQLPRCALVPLVVPANTPPSGGRRTGSAHVPAPGGLVLDVVVVEVTEVLVVDGPEVLVVDVVVVVVVGDGGGVTVSVNAPLAPPHDPA